MIAILLATYNSEKFIKKQIDSLLAQSFSSFTIYIRDDGSNDSTLEIIGEYRKRHSNIVLMQDSTKGRKAGGSFMWLLEHVKADYYMFCDHDDYWLPSKVEVTFLKMEKLECEYPNKPVLIFTDLKVVDSELNLISDSMWKYSNINPEYAKDVYLHSVSSSVTGCTVMINRYVREITLPYPKQAIIHDWWIALIVAKYGIIDYIAEPTILYRQHGNNEIGAQQVKRGHYLCRFYKLKNTISENIEVINMLNKLPFKINHLKRFLIKFKVILIKLR